MKIADFIILLLAVALIYSLFSAFWGTNEKGQYVIIQTPNEKLRYNLQQDHDLHLQGAIGESHIQIQAGQVRFLTSPCLNKICIRHGWLNRQGEAAACIPNKILVNITGSMAHYDAISF